MANIQDYKSKIKTEDYLHFQLEINQKNQLDLAVSMNHVEEVIMIKPSDICLIPGVVKEILGVINQRGRLLWIFSLKDLLQVGETDFLSSNSKRYVIIFKDDKKQLGCLVDNLKDILTINLENLAPVSLPMVNNFSKYINSQGNKTVLIDVSAIFEKIKI